MTLTLSNSQARQLFLYVQGLSEPLQRRFTPHDLYDLIVRLGFVQVDSIRTVERAHHLTLLARSARYRPDMLRTLLEDERLLFENWTHDAAVIPVPWYPYWQHRFAQVRAHFAQRASWQRRLGPDASHVLERVRQRVQQQGPVMAKDFADPREPGVGAWWGWGPSKTALEYLWRTGELAIYQRRHFQKVYDLEERVIPAPYLSRTPSRQDYIDWACRTALERLGFATPSELAAFWAAISHLEARAWCEQRVGMAVLRATVASADGSPPRQVYARHDLAELVRGMPAAPSRVRFLSPFDPVLRDRRRTRCLFNFDYRFEAFVPEQQRQYGYYVLPMLERDRLIGRIDLKCERRTRTLVVKGMWFEAGVRRTKARDRRIAEELERYSTFVGADTWVYEHATGSGPPSYPLS
jgi:uncharacterized protein YcaQ